jgi:hypothetical protein
MKPAWRSRRPFRRVGTLRVPTLYPRLCCWWACRALPTRLVRRGHFTCRANHLNPVQSLLQKYSASAAGQISRITPPVSRQMRDARDRHERAVRCDGRRWRARRTRLKRTAKSCGADAAVLAPSCAGFISCVATVARKPFTGEQLC